jgi:glycerophosphoryl diester phosphodiesterase
MIIAHRGVTYSGFPENSFPGFWAVLEEDYDGVEFDVRLTRDKELVVFHDIRLERLTQDGRGRVRTKKLSELRKLKLKSTRVDTGIPTLAEVLEIFKNTNKLINIEIKSELPMRGKIEQRVIDLIHHFGVKKQVVVSSFNPLVIKKIQKIDRGIRTGFIYQKRLPNFNQKLAKGLIVNSWHPNFKGVSALLLERAAEAGCAVYPWTVNEEEDFLRMKELEVDGVITDFPNLGRKILENQK